MLSLLGLRRSLLGADQGTPKLHEEAAESKAAAAGGTQKDEKEGSTSGTSDLTTVPSVVLMRCDLTCQAPPSKSDEEEKAEMEAAMAAEMAEMQLENEGAVEGDDDSDDSDIDLDDI
jgi:hypothetical protein